MARCHIWSQCFCASFAACDITGYEAVGNAQRTNRDTSQLILCELYGYFVHSHEFHAVAAPWHFPLAKKQNVVK